MSDAIRSALLWMILPLLACDRQVEAGYRGESLLQVNGRLSIPLSVDADTAAAATPAVAFRAASPQAVSQWPGGFDHLRLIPVTAEGSFPSRFTIHLFDPPPPEALVPRYAGEVAYAQGHLVVGHPELPAVLSTALTGRDCAEPRCGRRITCPGVAWPVSYYPPFDYQAGADCFVQELTCGERFLSYTYQDCTISSEQGNPALRLLGFSGNLSIVYFSEAVPQDSILAVLYNNGEAIAPGYHAYLPMAHEDRPTPECLEATELEAIRRYNGIHGTNLSGPPSDANDPLYAAYSEFRRLHYRVMRELGCPHVDRGFVELPSDATLDISLELQELWAP